ncbi:MAG: hypothetical protein AB8C84_02845 [Oligoflexales bacterium]
MKIILLSFLLFLTNCGEDEEVRAKATIQFANDTNLSLLSTLSGFSLTLKSIQLVNDVNGKDATDIWLNPVCSDSASCNSQETDFYDMMDVSAINTTLNNEAKEFILRSDTELDPQEVTFKYVRFYICGSDATPLKWSGGSVENGLSESNFCLFDSQEMDPPLTLKKDSSAVIEVSYDLSGDRVYLGSEIEVGQTRSTNYETSYNACSTGSDGIQWCFDVPPISAKVLVE